MKRQYPTLDFESGATAGILLRPVDGFAWREGLSAIEDLDAGRTTEPDRWLMPASGRFEGYAVFRRPNLVEDFDALARDIAELLEMRPSPADLRDRLASAIARFADRYGHLGRSIAVVEPGPSARVEAGEPLRLWLTEAMKFRELRELASALERDSASDRDLIRARVYWSRNRVTYERRKGSGRLFAVIASPKIEPNAWRQLRHGDRRTALDYYVCREVNRSIAGEVNPTILPFAGRRVRFFATTLRSAIYHEFQRELAGRGGSLREIECANPVCGELFRATRRDRRYCSNRCRSLAGYHRRDQIALQRPRPIRSIGIPAPQPVERARRV